MMTLALITIPTVTTLIMITLLVIWLTTRWNNLNHEGTRLGCVIAVLFTPASVTSLAWSLLTQPKSTITWVVWTLLWLHFLVDCFVIPLVINALRTDDDGAETREEGGEVL